MIDVIDVLPEGANGHVPRLAAITANGSLDSSETLAREELFHDASESIVNVVEMTIAHRSGGDNGLLGCFLGVFISGVGLVGGFGREVMSRLFFDIDTVSKLRKSVALHHGLGHSLALCPSGRACTFDDGSHLSVPGQNGADFFSTVEDADVHLVLGGVGVGRIGQQLVCVRVALGEFIQAFGKDKRQNRNLGVERLELRVRNGSDLHGRSWWE